MLKYVAYKLLDAKLGCWLPASGGLFGVSGEGGYYLDHHIIVVIIIIIIRRVTTITGLDLNNTTQHTTRTHPPTTSNVNARDDGHPTQHHPMKCKTMRGWLITIPNTPLPPTTFPRITPPPPPPTMDQ